LKDAALQWRKATMNGFGRAIMVTDGPTWMMD
jgi:hypothetical protein